MHVLTSLLKFPFTAEMKLIVCDVATKVNDILKMVSSGECRNKLKFIVVMNGLDGVDQDLAKKVNVELVTFKDAVVRSTFSEHWTYIPNGIHAVKFVNGSLKES